MITAETLPETGRRSPFRHRIVGVLVAAVAVATMVPTAALAQSGQNQTPSADNYVTTTVSETSAPVTVPTSTTVEENASSPSCENGKLVTNNQGSVVCSAAVQGDSGGSSGTLPQTGGSPSMMLGFGALAMVAGAMFLAAARRRRQLDGTPLPS